MTQMIYVRNSNFILVGVLLACFLLKCDNGLKKIKDAYTNSRHVRCQMVKVDDFTPLFFYSAVDSDFGFFHLR
jgi:hypothetical protein